jgi:hypothetical protein
MEELVQKAIELGITPRQLYDATTKRLETLSASMPPKKVLYNSCYGEFAYSKHFTECFQDGFQSRNDPALSEAINDFGRANAKMFQKAFSAYVIYQKYDLDNMIHRANTIYLKEQNEKDIAELIQKITQQEEFGSLQATYQDARTSQALHRFTQASLEHVKHDLVIELSLSLLNTYIEPSYFKDSFYPAYKSYQETKRPSYYEPGNMLIKLLKDANNPKAWFSAPGYQIFGISFLYEHAAQAPTNKVYDPFTSSCIDIPEEAYEGFGLLCASGDNANLRFKNVPALVEHYITESDGLEEVCWCFPYK